MSRRETIAIVFLLLVLAWVSWSIYQTQRVILMPGCGCSDVAEKQESDFEEASTKRRTRLVWFAGGAPEGLTEADFQRRVLAALNELSAFTLTDFSKTTSSNKAWLKLYVATDAMMWAKTPWLKAERKVYLEYQQGNWGYYTVRKRWGTPEQRIVEGATLHLMGHRTGIPHTQDTTSIMHANLPVMNLNSADKIRFQRKLGKQQ